MVNHSGLRGMLIGLVMVGAFLAGCDIPEPGTQPTHVVRDSADVQLVTSRGPIWDESTAWRIDSLPSLTLGGMDSDIGHLIWQVRDGTVLDDGRLALLAGGSDSPRLLLINREGQVDRAMGGAGRGPGEFVDPVHLQLLPEGSIEVWERNFGRITTFDTTGAVTHTRHIDLGRIEEALGPGHRGDVVVPLTDGSFVARARAGEVPLQELTPGEAFRRPIVYIRIHPDYSADTLGRYGGEEQVAIMGPDERMTSMFPLMFRYTSVKAGGEPPAVYVSHGDERGVDVYDGQGQLRRVVRRDATPLPMTSEDWKALFDIQFTGNRLPEDRRPALEAYYRENLPAQTEFPVMTAIRVDGSGYLWVLDRRIGSDALWSVFDEEGRWLGRIEVPLRTILDIGHDYVLGVHVDAMMVESVRMLNLSRTSSAGGR